MLKVFIVSSSALVGKQIKNLFSTFKGIEIIGYSQDASEAIDCIAKHKPAGIILDGRLPSKTGMEVLRRIKRENLAFMVIMYTNHFYMQCWGRGKDTGMEFFFEKPERLEAFLRGKEVFLLNLSHGKGD